MPRNFKETVHSHSFNLCFLALWWNSLRIWGEEKLWFSGKILMGKFPLALSRGTALHWFFWKEAQSLNSPIYSSLCLYNASSLQVGQKYFQPIHQESHFKNKLLHCPEGTTNWKSKGVDHSSISIKATQKSLCHHHEISAHHCTALIMKHQLKSVHPTEL